MVLKIVINDVKTGKSYKKELGEGEETAFFGKKLGETIQGELLGMPGYEFEFAGGSDNAGFPMRKDVPGVGHKKILTVKSVGVKNVNRAGMRIRKTVTGNTIDYRTAQLNLKVLKYGAEPLEKKEEKPEEKKEDKTAEAPNEKTE